MSELVLSVGGTDYGGWKTAEINLGIEQVSGTYRLSVSEIWPANEVPREINPGDLCVLKVDGEVVITGHVDDREVSYAKEDHTVEVAGRDGTGDLVDCSAVHKSGEWTGRKMESIAADLCRPFGIKVKTMVETGGALASWRIEQGEAAFECLERLARDRGVLLIADGLGNLLITRAGTERVGTELVRGENIKKASLRVSHRDRFSTYTVKGCFAGDDNSSGGDLITYGKATDAGVKRYRPLVILAEDQAIAETAKRRAKWEASVHAGRAVEVSVTIQGWKHASGIWRHNRLVHLRDEFLRIDQDMLIKSVRLSVDDQAGELAELCLAMPEAFQLIPIPETNPGDL